MGILEWLGEPANPGPVGDVELGQRASRPRSRLVVVVRGAVALLLLACVSWAILRNSEVPTPGLFVLGLYLVVAYFVHPEPDTSNLGWLGGLIDHPFRWSDDLNRFLLFWLVLIWPGRFVTESLVELLRLAVNACTGADR